MKISLAAILSLLIVQFHGQLELTHTSFKVNNLGQITTISEEGIDQYTAEGKLLKHYSEDFLGSPSDIDKSSSLESLIFYKDVPGFQLLDNTLSPHSTLYDMNLSDFQNVTAVCISNDNTFWAYDAVTFEVLRFDESYEILERSGNMAVFLGKDLDPVSMMISGNRLYIGDKKEGILVFDLFANYLLTIPISETMIDMDVTSQHIYAATSDAIIRLDKKGISESVYSIKGSSLIAMDIEHNMLHWGDGKSIHSLLLNSLFD